MLWDHHRVAGQVIFKAVQPGHMELPGREAALLLQLLSRSGIAGASRAPAERPPS